MIKAKFFKDTGEEKGHVDLPENIFGIKPSEAAVYYAVRNILANKRQGTASTKTRGEVSGGGRKPWRQKGTGRARHGSIRSPLWKGGGVVFGPKPRDYSYTIPAKMKRLALFSAFSHRAAQGNVFVFEKPELQEPKTRVIADMLKGMGLYGEKVLILHDGKDKNFYKSCRNIKNLSIIEAYKSNPYEILRHRYILLTTDGLEQLKEVFQ